MNRRSWQRLTAVTLVPAASLALGTGTASAAPAGSAPSGVQAQGYTGGDNGGLGGGEGGGQDLILQYLFGGSGGSGASGSAASGSSGGSAGGMTAGGSS